MFFFGIGIWDIRGRDIGGVLGIRYIRVIGYWESIGYKVYKG
jgi:hypothetical protein